MINVRLLRRRMPHSSTELNAWLLYDYSNIQNNTHNGKTRQHELDTTGYTEMKRPNMFYQNSGWHLDYSSADTVIKYKAAILLVEKSTRNIQSPEQILHLYETLKNIHDDVSTAHAKACLFV